MYCSEDEYAASLQRVESVGILKYKNAASDPVHPSEDAIQAALASLHTLPDNGIDLPATLDHLVNEVCPALANNASPRYGGFVTGGSTPAAQLADLLAVFHDQNVQVHLPRCSISTSVEDRALRMLADLLYIDDKVFTGRTITTGATASNILGLACGRNFVLRQLGVDVSEDGFGGTSVKIYCAAAHASIRKAASFVGIGRRNCIEMQSKDENYGVAFDLQTLEQTLAENQRRHIGSIVVVSLGEVNTGLSTPHIDTIKELCEKYNAWLHIDAAFGIFAGLYPPLRSLLDPLRLANSICLDGHKWLNIPYDCGMFFTRQLDVLKDVCASGPAAYLTMSASPEVASIESPLMVGIENSRRFRALPLYASLLCYGRGGYADMVYRNIMSARALDRWLRQSSFYTVLTPQPAREIGQNLAKGQDEPINIVLFTVQMREHEDVSAADERMKQVVEHVNTSGEAYITATSFRGRACARYAVSNWRSGLRSSTDVDESDEDVKRVIAALDSAVKITCK